MFDSRTHTYSRNDGLPADANALISMATSCRAANKRGEALMHYGSAARLLFDSGAVLRATGVCRSALELDPSDPASVDMLEELSSYDGKVVAQIASGILFKARRRARDNASMDAFEDIQREFRRSRGEVGEDDDTLPGFDVDPEVHTTPGPPHPIVPNSSDLFPAYNGTARQKALQPRAREQFSTRTVNYAFTAEARKKLRDELSGEALPTPRDIFPAQVEDKRPRWANHATTTMGPMPEAPAEHVVAAELREIADPLLQGSAPLATARALEKDPDTISTKSLFPSRRIANMEQVLATCPLFRNVSQKLAAKLLKQRPLRRLEAGSLIKDQGRDNLFIVISGEVAVTVKIKGQSTRVVTRLSTGDFFGEHAVLGKSALSTTYRAVVAGEYVTIPKAVVRAMAKRAPDMVGVLQARRETAIAELSLARSNIFGKLSAVRRANLIAQFDRYEVSKGETAIDQGAYGLGMCLVVKGRVDVSRTIDDKVSHLGELGIGKFFGTFKRTRSKATVTATKATLLYRLSHEQLVPLLPYLTA